MKLQLPPSLRTGGFWSPLSADKGNTLLLLATCALVLLPHAAHLPLWVFPVCASLMLWRAWVTFRGNRMPPRWLLVPIALLTMGGVYWTYKTILGREAGVAMLALLLALKLLEIRAKRDLFVVLFLCFFLILASFFHSQSIATAALTILAVIAILTTQASYQYTGAVPSLGKRLRLGAKIVGLALPLTLALFVLFPRIQGPLWGMPLDAHSGRTGLSDSMSPGNISKLARSDAIAFRASFKEEVPAKASLYWRGIVLGRYDGRTWTPLETRATASRQIALSLRGAPVEYQVTLEPHGKRWLFTLDVPKKIPEVDGIPATVSADLQLLAAQPINERIRYDAVSHVDYLLQPNEPAFALEPWLALPPRFNPRTLSLAAQLRASSSDEVGMIEAVLRMFREQTFHYTLEPPLLGRDGIDDFLFSTRAGFCEHYAGAFVVLMRAAGIPARVVTGYQGGEVNPTDGFMVVRQSDAHAWAEVWLKNQGWVRVDPTAAVAPERVERNLSSAIPRTALGGLISLDGTRNIFLNQWLRLRHGWDALSNAWNQQVLNYTLDKQRDLARRLGFENADWRTLAGLMAAFAIAALALTLVPLAVRQRRRDPLEVLYEKLCRRMAQQGYPRMSHEGPRAYAQRLAAAGSGLSERQKVALAAFLAHYERLRYGAMETAAPASLTTLKSLLSECR